jgi:hypothetical protein
MPAVEAARRCLTKLAQRSNPTCPSEHELFMLRPMRTRGVIPFVLALLAAAAPASACMVCFGETGRSPVDLLVEAEAVAGVTGSGSAARTTILNGTVAPRGRAAAQRAAGGRDAVLVLDAGGEWQRALPFTDALQPVIAALLAEAPRWRADADGSDRFAFFAALHDHPVPAVRDLAMGELARAPYGRLRGIGPGLDRAAIVRALREPGCGDWRRAHILLPGFDPTPGAQALVRAGYKAALRSSGADLEAWTVALLEIDGAPAVEALRDRHFGAGEPEGTVLPAIVGALAVQGREGDPALRPAVAAAFRSLAAQPVVAAHAARYLAWAEDWSQVEAFEAVLTSGSVTDPAHAFVISMYLEGAREAGFVGGAKP